jgi:hypothetical protein
VRDIYELIQERETEIDRYQKEIERIQKELDALYLTAKLLDDSNDVTRAAASPIPAAVREIAAYGSTAVTPGPAPVGPTPSAWASAKQFP